MSDIIARRIVIKGLVQGIGYRPFVAELAEQYQITGWVRNTAGIVTVMAVGTTGHMEQFLSVLSETKPTGAWIDEIAVEAADIETVWTDDAKGNERKTFVIEKSEEESGSKIIPYVPPDLPTCSVCSRQLRNRQDRRYRYPFISCTSCGPRYSIIEALPYDRDTITMKEFAMCEACAREYGRKGDMRRHAQTIACQVCGPILEYIAVNEDMREPSSSGNAEKSSAKAIIYRKEAAFEAAVRCITTGGIVAVKDIGGFHLACSPYDEKAVAMLRQIKGRERKPFAVMFPDIELVKKYCKVNQQEEKQLLSDARPIVLLQRKAGLDLAENVCGNSPDIGAMLPCNPLQILLADKLGPLVMTSANCSGEPMIWENHQMQSWMQAYRIEGMSLGILQHDRKILSPLDDSIVRIVGEFRQVFRRARGMVPTPIKLPGARKEQLQIFAAGGDMKACFCYTVGARAYLSQHLGDLEDEQCFWQYDKEIQRMQRLFGFQPETMVTDKHPGYISANQHPEGFETLKIHKVQHHHAHAASVIAEHGLRGKVLCVTFDGTGYGLDQTIWGSEFFLWDEKEMLRIGHLKPVDLIGGNEGAKNTDTILYGYLFSLGEDLEETWLQEKKGTDGIQTNSYTILRAALKQKINCVTSSSMGRLFDAVSALLDICHYNGYEGEAPIELEYLARKAKKTYPLQITILWDAEKRKYLGDTRSLFVGLRKGQKDGIPKEELALGFITAVAEYVCNMCRQLKDTMLRAKGVRQIALSGGTFQNRILLEQTVKLLKDAGFQVYINEQVPAGDGGVCLGQAYLEVMSEDNENGMEG